MDERTVQSLRATLAADRGALRRVRNRLICAEGALLPALNEWQDEGEPVARGHLRWVAGRRAKDVRRARRTLRGAIAAVRASSEALSAAIAECA
jgi:hypothetical protein